MRIVSPTRRALQVLGAAMFHVRVGNASVVYTGDYNMTPDRHLGAAWIDKLRPDVLITESTYATTIRDSKRARERDFLRKVHECIAGGGKVLVPVFALGRAQELCILLDTYWERMNLKVPIYFSAGACAGPHATRPAVPQTSTPRVHRESELPGGAGGTVGAPRPYGKGQPLLQAVHQLDQRKDQKDLCEAVRPAVSPGDLPCRCSPSVSAFGSVSPRPIVSRRRQKHV